MARRLLANTKRLLAAPDQLNRQPPRLIDITGDAQMPVDHRRIVEHEILLAGRRAVAVDERERRFRQRFGKLARIRDSRG